MNRRLPPLVVICGPTASGKTELALRLAERFDVEVVSADSRQVYRTMDVGTAKPNQQERALVPHHLIDVVDPDEDFTAADFVRQGREALRGIHAAGRLPLLVGGTGLYIQSLTEGLVSAPGGSSELRRELELRDQEEGDGALYALLQRHDPETAKRLPPADRVRIIRALEVFFLSGRPLSDWQRDHGFRDRPYRLLLIGLQPEREALYARTDARAVAMLQQGLVEECRALLGRGYPPGLKALQTIGYREVLQFLGGELDLEEALERIQRHTRRYAKRQLTWFRRDLRINWFESTEVFDKIAKLIDEFLME